MNASQRLLEIARHHHDRLWSKRHEYPSTIRANHRAQRAIRAHAHRTGEALA